VTTGAGPTLDRFLELRSRFPERIDAGQAKAILRELKAVGGDLQALRVALTGETSGPALWEVLAGLPRDEALRRATSGGRPS
jgi:Anticodon binding domain